MTRGIRNNNPLNIRLSKSVWWGQVRNANDKEFVTFLTMRHGLRAAFITLRTYMHQHNLHNVHDIISRWAPPSENDTESYIGTVCRLTKFGGYEPLTFCKDTVCKLVKAMALIESGADFSLHDLEVTWDEFMG